MGAAALLSGARAVCAPAIRFAPVAELAIAELSMTGACTARMSCLLCRGLFACEATVIMRDYDAWVQQSRPADRMLCAQRCDQSAGVTALAIAGLSTAEACAARMGYLLCHGLLSCGPTVYIHDDDA